MNDQFNLISFIESPEYIYGSKTNNVCKLKINLLINQCIQLQLFMLHTILHAV